MIFFTLHLGLITGTERYELLNWMHCRYAEKEKGFQREKVKVEKVRANYVLSGIRASSRDPGIPAHFFVTFPGVIWKPVYLLHLLFHVLTRQTLKRSPNNFYSLLILVKSYTINKIIGYNKTLHP